ACRRRQTRCVPPQLRPVRAGCLRDRHGWAAAMSYGRPSVRVPCLYPLTIGLVAIVVGIGVAGGGVLGAWQGLSENATNMVTAAAASAVAVHSVHCSGLTPAYPTTCTDAQGTRPLSRTPVPGSPAIPVQGATAPAGLYSTIATLAGAA